MKYILEGNCLRLWNIDYGCT